MFYSVCTVPVHNNQQAEDECFLAVNAANAAMNFRDRKGALPSGRFWVILSSWLGS
jgi:hypothetical protein